MSHPPPEQSGSSVPSHGPGDDADPDVRAPGSERPARARRDPDADLSDHDLSDHDEAFFPPRPRPWRGIGLGLFLAGLLATSVAAVHLGDMSGGTIGNAVLLPVDTPVNIRLDQGEQRMFYTERGSGSTTCTIADEADAPVRAQRTSPVILQGSDVLWHGSSLFTAPAAGDYTLTCHGNAAARVGRPVGTLDVVLTLLAAGLGGIATLTGLGVGLWGRRRARHQRPAPAPSPQA